MAVLPLNTPLRNSLIVSVLGAALFLLAGCQPKFVAYHSTASIPYSASSTATGMELVIGPEENASKRDFIVLKARDRQLANQGEAPVEYVLLAPKSSGSMSGYAIESANLRRSVPLPGETVETLIDGLAEALSQWDQSVQDGEAVFYEFTHAPEQDIERVSENVVEWTSSLRFIASHTPDGPTARMLLGNSPNKELQYLVSFEERAAVKDFRDTLIEAQSVNVASK
ncbi:hypothetical protein [Longibacter salinarum]|uniref:hypothetical protein n=1 Tax=Longibacter salinarum TaxID=1850348 RepID=UPI00117D352E|nr:hypothetical protein [Longibacter salinarum]